MPEFRCFRHGDYHEHAHHCPACIDYVATILRAVTMDRHEDVVLRDNANRALVMLGLPATPHEFTGLNHKTYSELCQVCDLPESNVIHKRHHDPEAA